MRFLARVFGKQASPAAAAAAQHQALVDELTAIGSKDGFLSFRPGGKFNQQCRHIRAREIGMRLNMIGGSSLMRRVYERVEVPNVRQLSAAWDEIGDWAG